MKSIFISMYKNDLKTKHSLITDNFNSNIGVQNEKS